MTARSLHTVLRALADEDRPDTDADLLRRYVATRDEEAFALLVKRHGRLVWAVCRHLARSDADADDAFQATFLILVRNAAKVKDAAKLSAWLHGVAYKVCGKSRLSAKRRAAREQATAARERNGQAIPESAWDRAMAAVHEVVAGLPGELRVPFVLCCLEGLGQTEAAERLGWKLGTLSGRLTRAKNAVIERLSARGLTLGVLAAVSAGAVPLSVSAKAIELGRVGVVVSGTVLQLSRGVIGMSIHKAKLLAVGMLTAVGIAVSGGSGWLATAEAEPYQRQVKASPAERVKQLEAELEQAKADARAAELQKARADARAAELEKARAEARAAEEATKRNPPTIAPDATNTTIANDYKFVVVSKMDQTKFMKFLQENEDKGWVFSGTTPMEDPKTLVWVFRRAKGSPWAPGVRRDFFIDELQLRYQDQMKIAPVPTPSFPKSPTPSR